MLCQETTTHGIVGNAKMTAESLALTTAEG